MQMDASVIGPTEGSQIAIRQHKGSSLASRDRERADVPVTLGTPQVLYVLIMSSLRSIPNVTNVRVITRIKNKKLYRITQSRNWWNEFLNSSST